jgi:hypothetical protein
MGAVTVAGGLDDLRGGPGRGKQEAEDHAHDRVPDTSPFTVSTTPPRVTRGPPVSLPDEDTGGPSAIRRAHRADAHEKGQPLRAALTTSATSVTQTRAYIIILNGHGQLRRHRHADRPGIRPPHRPRHHPRLPRQGPGRRVRTPVPEGTVPRRTRRQRDRSGRRGPGRRHHGPAIRQDHVSPGEPAFARLRQLLEDEWVPGLQAILGIETGSLPALWDADFLFGPKPPAARTATCCARSTPAPSPPFPPEAVPLLARATAQAVTAARTGQ